MDRRRFLRAAGGCALCAALARALAAAGAPWPRLARPDPASDEGGLWALFDREEQRLRQSPLRVADPAVADYVQGVTCRLAGDHCPDLRTYVMRTPWFNASMAPNGMMQVWTGLLLRCENEAQLAAVLGHEIGHYLRRDGLERLKDAKSKSAFATFAAAIPIAGPLAVLGTVAGSFAFSREQERTADRIGLELMTAAGYPAREAPRIWANLLDELKAEKDWSGDAGRRSRLFADHPPEAERQAALETQAKACPAGGDPGAAALRKAIGGPRKAWMEDELKRRRFGESVALLTRLAAADARDGEACYFLGEACRLRNGDGDPARARDAYLRARDLPGAPAEVHRALGFLHRKAGEAEQARKAFARYLELRPDADDAEMIRSYLEGGGG